MESRFGNKTIEELHKDLARVERERDGKGPQHPDYQHAVLMANTIKKAIQERKR